MKTDRLNRAKLLADWCARNLEDWGRRNAEERCKKELMEWCKRNEIEKIYAIGEKLTLITMERQLMGELTPEDETLSCFINLRGVRIAHVLAGTVGLPKGFNRWALADDFGWTVAHEAARWGNLPEDFDCWGLRDNSGQSVAYIALRHEDRQKTAVCMELRKKYGWFPKWPDAPMPTHAEQQKAFEFLELLSIKPKRKE